MNPPSYEESRKQSPSSLQQDTHLNYLDEEEVDFVALGMASAVLLHRVSSLTGLLQFQVRRLKECISSSDMTALELVIDMEKAVNSLGKLSAAVEILKKPSEMPSPLDVNSLVYDVCEELLASHTSKEVQVSFDLPESVPPVRADSHLLAEVFRSVLENSLDAMDKETGRIDIRSLYKRTDDTVEIEIEDNGTGIPNSTLSQLFRRPIPSTDSSRGLGLWLARLMLIEFGGDIRVKHTEIGHGTTVAITLPAANTGDTRADRDHD